MTSGKKGIDMHSLEGLFALSCYKNYFIIMRQIAAREEGRHELI